MDRECFVRLNNILQEVLARNRPVDDLDEIPSWFIGTEEEVKERVQEVQELFEDAYDNGMINRWIAEHARRGPSTNWDWTTTAHRKASGIGITLINPIGENKEDKETSMVINFSDGVSVDTSGELHVIRLRDGLYVTGRGFLIPVKDGEEAEATIREMSKPKGETPNDASG